jgi:hypothetical protein
MQSLMNFVFRHERQPELSNYLGHNLGHVSVNAVIIIDMRGRIEQISSAFWSRGVIKMYAPTGKCVHTQNLRD